MSVSKDFIPPEVNDESLPDEIAPSGPVEVQVRVKTEGMRLDHYILANVAGDFSRSSIQKAIEAGSVLVNGSSSKASYKVHNGDRLLVALPEPTHAIAHPENIPLTILYQDEFLAIIDKPANMVVHPAKGHWSGTLANAVAFHFGQVSQFNGPYRPGIVHRLDRDTSGVILIAKEESTHRALATMFEQAQGLQGVCRSDGGGVGSR